MTDLIEGKSTMLVVFCFMFYLQTHLVEVLLPVRIQIINLSHNIISQHLFKYHCGTCCPLTSCLCLDSLLDLYFLLLKLVLV